MSDLDPPFPLSKASPRLPDRYRVERLLGQGGFGRVYEAWDEKLSRKCAIKIAQKSEENERLLREAKAAASLNGPHIVGIHDVGHLDDGTPYLVMEYLEGCSIAELLKKRTRFRAMDALHWTHQICLALGEAHRAGVIHRDIKPSNLFLARNAQGDEAIKLLDFGLARSQRLDEGDVTQSGILVGSPAYMSPEQVRNQPIDARTDLWSTGVVLYRMLSGQHPFPHENHASVLASIVVDPPQPLEDFVPEISPDLVRIVERCLAKSPSNRFSSAQELDRALQKVAQSLEMDWSASTDRDSPSSSPTDSIEVETMLQSTVETGHHLTSAPAESKWRRLWPLALAAGIVAILLFQRIQLETKASPAEPSPSAPPALNETIPLAPSAAGDQVPAVLMQPSQDPSAPLPAPNVEKERSLPAPSKLKPASTSNKPEAPLEDQKPQPDRKDVAPKAALAPQPSTAPAPRNPQLIVEPDF